MKREFVAETGLSAERNTTQNLDYYAALADFFEGDPSGALMKLRSFAVYAPRQVISDFLVRYELFRMVRDVPGSLFEFGVFNGQGLFSFAHFSAIQEPYHLTREIVGFDTFSGITGVDEKDRGGDRNLVREGGLAADSYERLLRAAELFDLNRPIGHLPKIRLVRGDVLQTADAYLAQNPHTVAALLYLDLDVHLPTRHVLERFLPRVPAGGVVAFDELNHRSFPGETVALMETLDLGKVALRRLPFCSRISYFVKGA